MQKSLGLILILFLLLNVSCKKDVPLNNNAGVNNDFCSGCQIITTISADTNFIPHKMGNYWNYCNCSSNQSVDWITTVFKDSTFGKNAFFRLSHICQQTQSNSNFGEAILIDSNNVYTSIMHYNPSSQWYMNDSITIIKPKANNGDTIYKNSNKKLYCVLINKNDVFTYKNKQVPNCYHIKIYTSDQNIGYENFYKKGIGCLNFTGVLNISQIH